MTRLVAALSLLALLWSAPASAQQFWKKSDLLADMFPQAEAIQPAALTLTAAQRTATSEAIDGPVPLDTYTFYVASAGGAVLGYVLFDDQLGQHEPITFAVQFDATGVVLRQEIVVYREKYGGEVSHPRFRKQFQGKTMGDPVRAGKDISIVSGATYSSKSMALGVRRAIALTHLLIEQQAGAAE